MYDRNQTIRTLKNVCDKWISLYVDYNENWSIGPKVHFKRVKKMFPAVNIIYF